MGTKMDPVGMPKFYWSDPVISALPWEFADGATLSYSQRFTLAIPLTAVCSDQTHPFTLNGLPFEKEKLSGHTQAG